MKSSQWILVFCVALSCLGIHRTVWADDLILAKENQSEYVIVVAEAASAVTRTAAQELQDHLAEVTGVKLAITSEGQVPVGASQILVGNSDRLKELLPELNVDALENDAIVIKSVGKNLILVGHPTRGTLYAVYTFLEDVVGCRWWTSTESFIPKKSTLTVPALDICYAPKLHDRQAYYGDARNGVFAARLKCNGHHAQISPEHGGHNQFAGFVHTFYHLLPPEEYFSDHPEWYSEIGGQRTTENAQLCLTNLAMRAELVRRAIASLKANPEARFISISQNDCHGRCECAQCLAVEAEEGTPSGVMVRFVNAVAEEIEKEFPKVLVDTLAYQYTRKPPKLARPRNNVIVRLCSIECSFVQTMEGPQNEQFREDIVGWSRITPRIFIWDYVTNFSNYIVPHPNYRTLAPNIRFFVNHNVTGLFEQGDSGSSIGDFVRLRTWLLAHLMWNPYRDEQVLVRDFMEGYYGAASPYLTEYLSVICDAGEKSGKHLGCYIEDTSKWLTLNDLNKATDYFNRAEAAVADNPVLAERVRRDRLPLDHVWLIHYPALKRAAKLQESQFLGPEDSSAACHDFLRLAEKHNAGEYRENAPFASYAEILRSRFRAPGAPPKLCEALSENAWVDLQDGEFSLSRPGKLSALVDDPRASDGKAARMPGDHHEWAVSCRVSADIASAGPWHCFAVVRSEAKTPHGPAMSLGIYDINGKKNTVSQTLSVAESTGIDYRVVDLGKHALDREMYFWFAPTARPGEVDAVYIDRIFLIRDFPKNERLGEL